jgi:hypothetical protein
MCSLFPAPVCNKLLQRRGIVAYLTYCSIKSRLHCLWRPLEGILKRSCSLEQMKQGQSIMTADSCQHLNTALWVKRLSLWAETCRKYLHSEWARDCFTLMLVFPEVSCVFQEKRSRSITLTTYLTPRLRFCRAATSSP